MRSIKTRGLAFWGFTVGILAILCLIYALTACGKKGSGSSGSSCDSNCYVSYLHNAKACVNKEKSCLDACSGTPNETDCADGCNSGNCLNIQLFDSLLSCWEDCGGCLAGYKQCFNGCNNSYDQCTKNCAPEDQTCLDNCNKTSETCMDGCSNQIKPCTNEIPVDCLNKCSSASDQCQNACDTSDNSSDLQWDLCYNNCDAAYFDCALQCFE